MDSQIQADLESFDHNAHTFMASNEMDQSMATTITNHTMDGPENDFSVPPYISFGMEDFSSFGPDMCSHHGLLPTNARLNNISVQQAARQAEAESHCVFNLTQMIANLQRYIFMELKALEIILGVTKRCVTQLRKLLGLQQAPVNFRCIALFSIAMDQIISLFEAGCSTFNNNSGPFGEAHGPMGRLNGVSSLPSIGFGTFQLDEEEQKTWQKQIVTKELQISLELLHRIEAISPGGPALDSRETWLKGFALRLTALLEKVGG